MGGKDEFVAHQVWPPAMTKERCNLCQDLTVWRMELVRLQIGRFLFIPEPATVDIGMFGKVGFRISEGLSPSGPTQIVLDNLILEKGLREKAYLKGLRIKPDILLLKIIQNEETIPGDWGTAVIVAPPIVEGWLKSNGVAFANREASLLQELSRFEVVGLEEHIRPLCLGAVDEESITKEIAFEVLGPP